MEENGDDELTATIDKSSINSDDDTGKCEFQKPSKYLKCLPISHSLVTEDADKFYNKVREQLSAAVLLQDIKQGARFWSSELSRLVHIFREVLVMQSRLLLI